MTDQSVSQTAARELLVDLVEIPSPSGEEDAAAAHLRESFVSPCERERPSPAAVERDHDAACLRDPET